MVMAACLGGLPPSIPLLHCINSTVDYTVGPLYSGHHCDPAGCPVWRGTPNSDLPRFRASVVSLHDVPEVLLCAIKRITLNLIPTCSTMCSVLASAVNAHIAESALLP